MDEPTHDPRRLAAALLDEVEEALLDLVAAGSGRLLVEVRTASRDRRLILVTRGRTSSVTLPATDLGAETLARLDQRRSSSAPPPESPPPPPQGTAEGRRYLDSSAVARRYGITPGAVRQRLRRGRLPPPIVVGRRRLWDERDLDRFDDAHRLRRAGK